MSLALGVVVPEEEKGRDWKISCVRSSFFMLTVWRDSVLKAQENAFDGLAPSGTISFKYFYHLFLAHSSSFHSVVGTCFLALLQPNPHVRRLQRHRKGLPQLILRYLCLPHRLHLLGLAHRTALVPLSSYPHRISTPYPRSLRIDLPLSDLYHPGMTLVLVYYLYELPTTRQSRPSVFLSQRAHLIPKAQGLSPRVVLLQFDELRHSLISIENSRAL
jgi:hypothetical protein